MIRGFVSIPDSTGSEVYKEFALNSTDVVRFHIQQNVDGTLSNLDVSSAALTIKFRAKNSAGSLLVDTTMTKISTGSTGIVEASIKFSEDDWANDDVADCGIVIINTGVSDGDTPSGFQETLVYGTWQAIIRSGVTS